MKNKVISIGSQEECPAELKEKISKALKEGYGAGGLSDLRGDALYDLYVETSEALRHHVVRAMIIETSTDNRVFKQALRHFIFKTIAGLSTKEQATSIVDNRFSKDFIAKLLPMAVAIFHDAIKVNPEFVKKNVFSLLGVFENLEINAMAVSMIGLSNPTQAEILFNVLNYYGLMPTTLHGNIIEGINRTPDELQENAAINILKAWKTNDTQNAMTTANKILVIIDGLLKQEKSKEGVSIFIPSHGNHIIATLIEADNESRDEFVSAIFKKLFYADNDSALHLTNTILQTLYCKEMDLTSKDLTNDYPNAFKNRLSSSPAFLKQINMLFDAIKKGLETELENFSKQVLAFYPKDSVPGESSHLRIRFVDGVITALKHQTVYNNFTPTSP